MLRYKTEQNAKDVIKMNEPMGGNKQGEEWKKREKKTQNKIINTC